MPVAVVATVLLMEHLITLLAPLWERALFFGGDKAELRFLQNIEERLLTQGDLRQFLEAILAAVRDHMQSPSAFVAALDGAEPALLITAGRPFLERGNLPQAVEVIKEESGRSEFLWNDYWILPLRARRTRETAPAQPPPLIGLLGVARTPGQQSLEPDQQHALWLLAERAALALEDRQFQQRIFRSLEEMDPQVEVIQRIRAMGRFDAATALTGRLPPPDVGPNTGARGPQSLLGRPHKLTEIPAHEPTNRAGNRPRRYPMATCSNALRAIPKRAVEQVRPDASERRFTTEWILYRCPRPEIFMEGRKVREVANRLAMSEADLYTAKRGALPSKRLPKAILEMESQRNSTKGG